MVQRFDPAVEYSKELCKQSIALRELAKSAVARSKDVYTRSRRTIARSDAARKNKLL